MDNDKKKSLPSTTSTDSSQEIITIGEYFQDEMSELNQAISEIDDLYKEIKSHFDVVMQSSKSGKAPLSFIHLQTGNLVKLKDSKANLIGNKVTLKKINADLAMKQKGNIDNAEKLQETISAIMERIDSTIEVGVIDSDEDYNYKENFKEENEDIDDELERRINKLKKQGKIEGLEQFEEEFESNNDNNEKEIEKNKIEGILGILVKDKKWKFIGIDENNHIIKGFPVPEKKNFKIKLHTEKDGTKVAIDQNDRIYPVIKR